MGRVASSRLRYRCGRSRSVGPREAPLRRIPRFEERRLSGVRASFGSHLRRSWRAGAAAGLLLVCSNGPVLRFAGWLDRPGLWNDPAVWPFFAGAAAASVVFAWVVWRGCDDSTLAGGGVLAGGELSRPALAAVACYSAVAVVSSLWSVYPGATLWRSVVYLGLALLAVALAGLSDDELSTAVVLLASVAVAGSLAVIVVLHDIGTDERGSWIGMYTNRNSLAPMAALGVIGGLRWLLPQSMSGSWGRSWRAGSAAGALPSGSAGAASRLSGMAGPASARETGPCSVEAATEPAGAASDNRTGWRRGVDGEVRYHAQREGAGGGVSDGWRWVGGAALVVASLVTLIGAGSRTAWLALAAALALASALGALSSASRSRGWRPRRTQAAAAGGGFVAAWVCAIVVAAAWDVTTFSQRRTIWSLVWDRVLERPWGGYGFFAFWEVPELVQEHVLLQRGSAHNSLVETALGLGLAGTVPFVVLVMLAAVNAGRGLWLRPSADTAMWAAVTVFVLVENMTESFVLWFSHIWVLLLAAALRRSAPATGAGGRCPLTAVAES